MYNYNCTVIINYWCASGLLQNPFVYPDIKLLIVYTWSIFISSFSLERMQMVAEETQENLYLSAMQ